jgi:hypothetical protein
MRAKTCSCSPHQPPGAYIRRKVIRYGSTYWKVLELWKNDQNVALWRYNRRRNVSHCLFRVQRKRPPTKRKVDRLMALGLLDICDWFSDWYVLCCPRFRRPLTHTVRRRLTRVLFRERQRYTSIKNITLPENITWSTFISKRKDLGIDIWQ